MARHPLKQVAAEIVSEAEFDALITRAQEASGASHADAPHATAQAPGEDRPEARGAEAPHAYIGFEPSGTAHVGWMVCTDTVRRLLEAGFRVTILLADWHARINDKFGGDPEAIAACAAYMEEAFTALGVPRDRVTYRYAEELAGDRDYWELVVQVAKHTSLARMKRAMTIMGRREDEADADVSRFLYPAMQVADIFHMKVDLAYGGLDQRHAHMLARDVAHKLGRTPPVALHTPLVPSLKQDAGRMDPVEAKMSKSDPSSGILIHDGPDEVKAKLKGAHCPAKETEGNPVWDLLRLVVWPRLADLHDDGPPRFQVHRPRKFGGDKIYMGLEALEAEFKSGALHPLDLKMGVADALNRLLEPVHAHFQGHPETLDRMRAWVPTR